MQKIETLLSERAAAKTAAPAPADDGKAQKELRSEIENLKYTVDVMQGKKEDEDADLEDSIARLKKELSEVAGIIGTDGKDDKK